MLDEMVEGCFRGETFWGFVFRRAFGWAGRRVDRLVLRIVARRADLRNRVVPAEREGGAG